LRREPSVWHSRRKQITRLAERLRVDDTLTEENLVFLKQLGVSDVIVNVGSVGGETQRVASRLVIGDHWEASDLLDLGEMIKALVLDSVESLIHLTIVMTGSFGVSLDAMSKSPTGASHCGALP
jgi:hypothetical protein